MSESKQTAMVKCPECSHKTELYVPQDTCLPMYKCKGCNKLIALPKDSESCCVICEYSEGQCPMPNKHKKE